MNTQDNKPDKQMKIVPYPKDRVDGIVAVGNRLNDKAETLSEADQEDLWAGVMALKDITPTPRVSRIIGNFLIDMADEQDRQDKVHGTDSNSRNQYVVHVKKGQ